MRLHAIALCLFALASCRSSLRTCSDGCLSGSYCDEVSGLCLNGDGGSGGAGGNDGGCSPACPDWQQCSASMCLVRYARLEAQAPLRTATPLVPLTATLELFPNRTANDPPALEYRFVGADAGTPLPRLDAGLYGTSLPLPEGLHQLRVDYPAAGITDAVTIVVDRTAPTAEVRIAAPPTRENDGGFNATDSQGPSYRRDERVTVIIDSPDPDPARFQLEVNQPDGGIAQRFSNVSSECPSAFPTGVCRQQTVDLWRHAMPAYRSSVSFVARVEDDVANAAAFDGGSIAVTRHRWYLRLPGTVTSFALTRRGDLVLHQQTQVSSWTSGGQPRWAVPLTETSSFESGLMVGASSVYFSEQVLSSNQYRFSALGIDVPDASTVFTPAETSGLSAGPSVLVTRGGNELPFFAGRGEAGGLRQDILYGWNPSDGGVASARWTAPLGSGTNQRLIFTDDRLVRVLVRNNDVTGSWRNEYSLATPDGFPPTAHQTFEESAVSSMLPLRENDLVLAITDGGASALVSSTGRFPTASLPLRRAGVIAGAGMVYANDEAPLPGGQTLCRLPLDGGAPVCANLKSFGGSLTTFLGGDRTLYVSTLDDVATLTGFRVRAIDAAALTPQWETPLIVNGSFARPRALDCTREDGGVRPGGPGVLYTTTSVSTSTFVEAIVVDSPGIDSAAPWPMETHDPRNTSNLTTPLSEFACP